MNTLQQAFSNFGVNQNHPGIIKNTEAFAHPRINKPLKHVSEQILDFELYVFL